MTISIKKILIGCHYWGRTKGKTKGQVVSCYTFSSFLLWILLRPLKAAKKTTSYATKHKFGNDTSHEVFICDRQFGCVVLRGCGPLIDCVDCYKGEKYMYTDDDITDVATFFLVG